MWWEGNLFQVREIKRVRWLPENLKSKELLSLGEAHRKSGKGFHRRCCEKKDDSKYEITQVKECYLLSLEQRRRRRASSKQLWKNFERESSRLNEIHIRLASRVDAEVQGICNLKRYKLQSLGEGDWLKGKGYLRVEITVGKDVKTWCRKMQRIKLKLHQVMFTIKGIIKGFRTK